MATKFSETAEYQKGLVGEESAYDCWIRDGFYVVRTRDFTTAYERAPLIHHGLQPLVLPDFLLFYGGQGLWVDCKAKDHPNFFRNWNRLEHGIDLRRARGYEQAQQETGLPLWIVVCELDSGRFLCKRLDRLMENARIYEGGSYRAMANFAQDEFTAVDPDDGGAFVRVFLGINYETRDEN